MVNQLLFALIFTLIVTPILVFAAHWIRKNKEKHPLAYKNRRVAAAITWLVLNNGDL